MVAQSASVLDSLTGSSVGFVCFVCSCLLGLIVLATVFSGKFRSDVLAGSGQATVFGLFSVTGASVLAFVALLIGGAVITAKQASDLPALTKKNSDLNDLITAMTQSHRETLERAGLPSSPGPIRALRTVAIEMTTGVFGKAENEAVLLEVWHDGTRVGDSDWCGADETWSTGQSRTEVLGLSPIVLESEIENIIIRVKKRVPDGTHNRWVAQFDAMGELCEFDPSGQLSEARGAGDRQLLKTPEVTIGGPYDSDEREFTPDRYERVELTPRPLYRRIFVDNQWVADGYISPDNLTYAPVRAIAEALGGKVHYGEDPKRLDAIHISPPATSPGPL